MTRQTGALIGLTAAVAFLLGLVVADTRPGRSRGTAALTPPAGGSVAVADAPAALSRDARAVPAAGVDFASVAARVNAAVVNVDTASRGNERLGSTRRGAIDDPDAPHEGSGSGFIIDASGLVLTNHHVVVGADRITVTLADGRALRADIVGTDPALDVALLRIHGREPFPVAPLGDSSSLRVGQWVCAIGNPLGVYAHSVTVGVVSFLGRKLFEQGLAGYIQTDAAISFGNSGGPLIDAHGDVVGITTAINAQAMNIGFAIPISQVTSVLAQLRAGGSVARGYLDMGLTTVTPELQHALRLAPDHGALVQDVPADTHADRAGLRAYDVITAIDAHAVRSAEDLTRQAAALAPGAVATLDVWRDGATRQLPIKLGLRRVVEVAPRGPYRATDARPISSDRTPLGIAVRDLDADAAIDLRIPGAVQGVLVDDVDTAGPAHVAHVRPGQVIIEVNRRPVRSAADYRAVTSTVRSGDAVALLIYDRLAAARVIRIVVADAQP
jgi:serine protease Do